MMTKKTILLLSGLLFSLVLFAQKNKYPEISNQSLILQGDKCGWDANTVHTFSIVEVNKDGYKYWAYYALDHYNDRDPFVRKGGLARSNDLLNWEKYENNPIINKNCRWPTVIYKNNTFYMFYAEYNDDVDSRIVMLSSKDGIDFGNRTLITEYQSGQQNQNPFIYFNDRDNTFYLFYYNGTERAKVNKRWNIMVKKNKDINKLKDSDSVTVISSDETIAAPSVAFYNGTYYLLVEEFNNSKLQDRWVTNAFYSDKIDSGYKRVTNNPILSNNDACAFQYMINGKLYVSYSHAVNEETSKWNLQMIKLK